jgi:hypothetical protein
MDKYITGIKGLEAFDAAVVKAHQTPGKLAIVQPGWYLVERDGELVEIMRRTQWDAHEVNRKWVSDATLTLAEMKASLGL